MFRKLNENKTNYLGGIIKNELCKAVILLTIFSRLLRYYNFLYGLT